MRVDHRRVGVLVAQRFLAGAYATVVLQKVCGEAAARGVGADRFEDARPLRHPAVRLLRPFLSRWWRRTALPRWETLGEAVCGAPISLGGRLLWERTYRVIEPE